MKVSLITTAPGSGAETIAFLKVGAVLPGAFFFTWLFTRIASKYTREQIFYIMLSLFLGFYVFFLVLVYPNRELLEIKNLDVLFFDVLHLPAGFSGLVAVLRHWYLSIFYVVSELWSAVILSMLLWGYANEVTKVNEAKRFYAIFALAANASGIFSGYFAKDFFRVSTYNPMIPYGETAWSQTFFIQISAVILIGVAVMFLFNYLTKIIDADQRQQMSKDKELPDVKSQTVKPKKPKLGLRECFAYMFRSRYLTYIVILVVSYSLVYNLVDLLFTNQAHHRFSDPADMNVYMNQVTSLTGICAVVFAFFISGNVIRKFGWTIAAIITPVIWLICSTGFFYGLLADANVVQDVAANFILSPGNLALFFGALQICLGRACKYTVFDETKEIAFIPLSKDNQRKGKAVVDGVASRLGKSGGSVIILALLAVFGTLERATPYIAAIVFISVILWIVAVYSLGKMVRAESPESPDATDDSLLTADPLSDDIEPELDPVK